METVARHKSGSLTGSSFSGGATPLRGDNEVTERVTRCNKAPSSKLGSYSSTKKSLASSARHKTRNEGLFVCFSILHTGKINRKTDFAELKHKVTPRSQPVSPGVSVHPSPLQHHVLSHPGPLRTTLAQLRKAQRLVNGFLLRGRVVQLVFSGSAETGLHSGVSPQPLDDTGQLGGHHAFLRTAR